MKLSVAVLFALFAAALAQYHGGGHGHGHNRGGHGHGGHGGGGHGHGGHGGGGYGGHRGGGYGGHRGGGHHGGGHGGHGGHRGRRSPQQYDGPVVSGHLEGHPVEGISGGVAPQHGAVLGFPSHLGGVHY